MTVLPMFGPLFYVLKIECEQDCKNAEEAGKDLWWNPKGKASRFCPGCGQPVRLVEYLVGFDRDQVIVAVAKPSLTGFVVVETFELPAASLPPGTLLQFSWKGEA